MWPWLINIGQWLVKLIGGWLPIGTKPVSEWAGKVLWAVGISAVVCLTIVNFKGCGKGDKPTQQIKTKGDVSAPNYYIRPMFGCATINYQKPIE